MRKLKQLILRAGRGLWICCYGGLPPANKSHILQNIIALCSELLHIYAKKLKSVYDLHLYTEIHYKCSEPAVMVCIVPAVMMFHKLNLGSEMVLSAGVIVYTTHNLISHGCTQ